MQSDTSLLWILSINTALGAEAGNQATATAAAEKAGAEMAGAARAAAARTSPVVTNPASAESWAFLEAILQSGPAASILSRPMCGALGKTRGVTAGSEMAAAVADDTHRFCHRCDQLIASLEAIDQDVPVEPAAAVKAAVRPRQQHQLTRQQP